MITSSYNYVFFYPFYDLYLEFVITLNNVVFKEKKNSNLYSLIKSRVYLIIAHLLIAFSYC